MPFNSSDDKAEADVEKDDARVNSRVTGGVEDPDKAEQASTTSPTPDAEYVGRIAGDDAGDFAESGAERRAQAD